MYKHVVLWKLRETPDGPTRTRVAAEVRNRLETLPGIIPEIRDFEVGINTGAYRASFFDVSLVASYQDEEAFRRYCVHPAHDAVVAYIQSVTEAEEIVDYLA